MSTALTASLEDLLRTLIKSVPASEIGAPEARQDGAAEEAILDLEVDGVRYLLLRLPAPAPVVQLSPREREIVRLVSLGHSNKIIADVLSISSWTVSTHLRRIFAKLGVGSLAAMVAQVSIAPVRKNQASGFAMVSANGELTRQRFG